MDIYINHMNKRLSLITNLNAVDSDMDDDDDDDDCYSNECPNGHSGGSVYMSADSDPNVIRINTWN